MPSSLTTLDLHNNSLPSMTTFVNELALDKLVYLDLSSNLIDSLTFFPANLSMLSSLNLAGNQLRLLNDNVFVNLTSLTYLGRNENKLVALSDNTFKG